MFRRAMAIRAIPRRPRCHHPRLILHRCRCSRHRRSDSRFARAGRRARTQCRSHSFRRAHTRGLNFWTRWKHSSRREAGALPQMGAVTLLERAPRAEAGPRCGHMLRLPLRSGEPYGSRCACRRTRCSPNACQSSRRAWRKAASTTVPGRARGLRSGVQRKRQQLLRGDQLRRPASSRGAACHRALVHEYGQLPSAFLGLAAIATVPRTSRASARAASGRR